MLEREVPTGHVSGRVIELARSRLAPFYPDSQRQPIPLQPLQQWGVDVQPLCYFNDEPVGIRLSDALREDWIDGREWLSWLPASWHSLLATALQVGAWLENHRFCGRCGAKTRNTVSEFAMHCDQCGQRQYPRISPCIITLVTYGDEMLLGRSPRFPPGRFSTLAGFIEPGESAEEAVHREVHEEVGVTLDTLTYSHSQAWPFPHSLMLGYHATASCRDIVVDGVEIVDAGWFTADRLPDLPPLYSISRALIEAHLAGR